MSSLLTDKEQPAGVTDEVAPELSLRTCRTCGVTKPLTHEFFEFQRPDSRHRNGVWRSLCRLCRNQMMRERRLDRLERTKALREENEEIDCALLESLPTYTAEERRWKRLSSCRGLPWFEMSTKRQKQACSTCPVVSQCRDLCDAVETSAGFGNTNSQQGVWGNETPPERRKRRAAQNKGGSRSAA